MTPPDTDKLEIDYSLARILKTEDGSSAGAAFLVAKNENENLICTCAHVVSEALGFSSECSRDQVENSVWLDFPEFPHSKSQADVVHWVPIFEGDIAVLKLHASTPPPEGMRPVRLVKGMQLKGKFFETRGYPYQGEKGPVAEGTVKSKLPGPKEHYQLESEKVTGYRVTGGYSGAPVLLPGVGVVGMIVEYELKEEVKAGYMTPVTRIVEACPGLADLVVRKTLQNFRDAGDKIIERPDKVQELHERFDSGSPEEIVQVICGSPGVGKTTLALDYARACKDLYDVLWMVRAAEPSTRDADLGDLARKLGLPVSGRKEDQPAVIRAVQTWLQDHPRWLLIFDDATEPEDILEYLPENSEGHTIITSTSKGKSCPKVPLGELDREAVGEFLRRRGIKPDPNTLSKLYGEIGGLPLMLEQVAAYITECECTLEDFLEDYAALRNQIWYLLADKSREEQLITTMWDLSRDRVRKKLREPGSDDLLLVWAFLAPDKISESVFKDGGHVLPEPLATKTAVWTAFVSTLSILDRYFLVQKRDSGYEIQRLLQTVVRDKLAEEGTAGEWAAAAVRLVGHVFEAAQQRAECEELLPHALATAGHAESFDVEPEVTASLLSRVGEYLMDRSQFKDAEPLFSRALKLARGIDEERPCRGDVSVRNGLFNLGWVTYNLATLREAKNGRELMLEDAKRNYEKAREIDERHLREGQVLLKQAKRSLLEAEVRIARDLNNLGLVLEVLGERESGESRRVKLQEAKGMFEEALKIDEQVFEAALDEQLFGAKNPEIARAHDLHSLGWVLHLLGDDEGAIPHLRRALKFHDAAAKKDPSNQPNVARILVGLGLVQQSLGEPMAGRSKDENKLTEARNLFKKALEIDKKFFSPDTQAIPIADDLHALGWVTHLLGDDENAVSHLEQAVRIYEYALGTGSFSADDVRKHLNEVRQALECQTEAVMH
jgi:tetratricopeptide (TPR) repeat protein